MSKILVVIYAEINGFPPTFNMLNYLANKNFIVSVISRGLDNTSYLINHKVKKYFIGKNIDADRQLEINILSKFYLYIKFMFKLLRIVNKNKPKFILAYDPIALAFVFLVSKITGKNFQIWYHNHDILEISSNSGFLQKMIKILEIKSFSRLKFFSLPSIERKEYFPLKVFNGAFFLIPNYPSKLYYQRFYLDRTKNINDEFHIIFQGAISKGHGIEQIIPLIGQKCPLYGKKIYLNLKGKIMKEYKEHLIDFCNVHKNSDFLIFHDYSLYEDVPLLASKCHLGIAIFTQNDIMNNSLGSASNKIYEYIAVGTPVIYFNNQHFNNYLSKYSWAYGTDLSYFSILNIIIEITNNFSRISYLANESFNSEFYFEKALDNLNLFDENI
jgi:hypothetical protein